MSRSDEATLTGQGQAYIALRQHWLPPPKKSGCHSMAEGIYPVAWMKRFSAIVNKD